MHVYTTQIIKNCGGGKKKSRISPGAHQFHVGAAQGLCKRKFCPKILHVVQGRRKMLFLNSTTNLGFMAFKLCYRKGPHSQEDFQRLIYLFIKKKKDTKHSYNCHFLNRTAPNHISIRIRYSVSYFILMPHFFLSCQVQTLSFYLVLYLLLSLSNPFFVSPSLSIFS